MPLISKGQGKAESIPLCIDVDGTLLKTDLLFESLLQLIKQKPWLLPWVPVWLIQSEMFLELRRRCNNCDSQTTSVSSSKSAHNVLDISLMSSIARSLFKDVPVFQRMVQHLFERLVGHVRDGSRVLDIGCGSGLLLGLMAGTGLEFEGVALMCPLVLPKSPLEEWGRSHGMDYHIAGGHLSTLVWA